ncbi:MAG: LysM peptidoglycan-binding domain-containing protein [Spirochaetaceae bacterium]|jgi:nucleoid-associated protein YgaU|nr:LysM peptidoglycan-binding domain-containing protein [Spirochaetaceae bacterium]
MKRFLTAVVMLNAALAAFSAATDAPPAGDAEALSANRFYAESIKCNNLARLSFAGGDYDAALRYSAESLKNAALSNDYVTQRLKIAAATRKIDEAESRLKWADRTRASAYFPKEVEAAKGFFDQALSARGANEWDSALNNAINVVETLAAVTAPPSEKSPPEANAALPSQYKVRPWDAFGDCFWNIAGRPWAYNNPFKWPILYTANKSKLTDPDNPDLIEPGLVLDIPSINGEKREGMWDSGRRYSPLDR